MTTLDSVMIQEPPSERLANPWLAPATLIPGAIVALLAAVVIAPGLFASYTPDQVDPTAILHAPSAAHWFGTDELGRDLFARVVYGARYSLLIGVGATALSFVVGTIIGVAAVVAPWGLNRLVVRLLDILLAFPELLLALLVIVVLGHGPVNTALAVGVGGIAGYARLIRSQILQVRVSGYVEHAKAIGERPYRIVVGHIVPNTVRPLLVLATVGVGSAILNASGLSFLGLGVVPPIPEWGALLADGRNYLQDAPWASLFPAGVVAFSVISITLFGRRLQRNLAFGVLS